jgi:hypothetical protein
MKLDRTKQAWARSVLYVEGCPLQVSVTDGMAAAVPYISMTLASGRREINVTMDISQANLIALKLREGVQAFSERRRRTLEALRDALPDEGERIHSPGILPATLDGYAPSLRDERSPAAAARNDPATAGEVAP